MAKNKKDIVALDYLKDQVFPELHQAMMVLIDHVVKTEEVRKHQENLKKIKIFDKLEQRRVEKERLKQELGSDYESSEDSFDWEEMGINKSEAEKYIKKKDEKVEEKQGEEKEASGEGADSEPSDKQSEGNKYSRQGSKEQDLEKEKKTTQKIKGLGQIAENEEQVEDEDNEENELEEMKMYLQRQREAQSYSPLIHLSELLREIIRNRS